HRPLVALVEGPLPGGEVGLAAAVADPQHMRVVLALGDVVGGGDVEAGDPLAGDVFGDGVGRVGEDRSGDDVHLLFLYEPPRLGQSDVGVTGVVFEDGLDGDAVDDVPVLFPVHVPAALHVDAEGGDEPRRGRDEPHLDGSRRLPVGGVGGRRVGGLFRRIRRRFGRGGRGFGGGRLFGVAPTRGTAGGGDQSQNRYHGDLAESPLEFGVHVFSWSLLSVSNRSRFCKRL